ncbi:MAG: hypothetical protein FIA94_05745 [Nitrospirae bacterium]|nr:hypothetical protein [Nitrospirota bacterium]
MKRVAAMVLFAAACAVCSPAGAAQEQAPVYSNRDIEKYKQLQDPRPAETKRDTREERRLDAREAKNSQERERWCKRASAQKKKIEKAQYDVQSAEKALRHEEEKDFHGGKKSKQLKDKLQLAKRKLANEERDLSDIENEAHRKGIPPGWLRCQVD